jgi:hypothetical protein
VIDPPCAELSCCARPPSVPATGENVGSEWVVASEAEMATELERIMEAVPGGTSRFGALASVLIEMGNTWRFYSPPCTYTAHRRARPSPMYADGEGCSEVSR